VHTQIAPSSSAGLRRSGRRASARKGGLARNKSISKGRRIEMGMSTLGDGLMSLAGRPTVNEKASLRLTQRDQRVHTRGAARWQITPEERDDEEEPDGAGDRYQVVRTNAEQQA
jgi:hypothetical protein